MIKTYLIAALLGTCCIMNGQILEPSAQNFQGVFYGDISVGDLNGDNKPDFIITGAKPGYTGYSRIYMNDNGLFSELQVPNLEQLMYSSVLLEDINNDGKKDILITGTKTSSTPQETVFEIYINIENGNFYKRENLGIAGVNNGSIQVADFNGDGRKDILVNGNSTEAITKIYFQQINGTFQEAPTALMGSQYGATKIFDANGDGFLDILVTGISTNYTPDTKLYLNSGTGEFTEKISGIQPLSFSSIDAADIDGDGDMDLLVSGMDMVPSYSLKIYLNDGVGNFTETANTFQGTSTGSAKFVDYNNDGLLDVFSIGTNAESNNTVQLYKNTGNLEFVPDTENSNAITALNMAKATWLDIEGDGDQDLLTIGFDGETALTKLYVNNIAVTTCSEPGNNPGDLGCVQFIYKGEQVTYITVRGSDGNIWLQQNLGSSKVADAIADAESYGDLFQWGRWDDGHQARNSALVAVPTPNNPLGIAEGSSNYFTGTWWTPNSQTDKWEAPTPAEASDSNGCDPCKALGQGWKIPNEAEWTAIKNSENITNPASALASNLKLPGNGYRSNTNGSFTFVGARGYYWSATPSSTGGKYLYVGSVSANASAGAPRGQGAAIRCMKFNPAYCDVSVDFDVEPITSVNFADINNETSPIVNGTPAYEDFTSIIGNVNRGTSYDITVKGNTVGFEHDIRVFIDWNKDGVFDMNTEFYPLVLPISTGTDAVAATGTIAVPADAALGNTRMRIIKDQWNVYEPGDFDACLNAYYGQIEDYTINIQPNLSAGEFAKNNFSVYPNPTSGNVTIEADLEIENITIYNQLGQLIATQKDSKIDLSNATPGMYIVKIKFVNGQTAIQKLLKK